jgi:hypothetical protein
MQPVEAIEAPITPGKEGLHHLCSQALGLHQHVGYLKIRVIGEMHVQIDDDFSLFNLMEFWLK